MRLYPAAFLPLLGIFVLTTPFSAKAQSRAVNTADIQMAVAITNGCTLVTDPLYFGLLIGTAGAARSSAGISVQCTTDVDFSITMDYGLHANGINRRMSNPTTGDHLRYRLYSDPGYSQRWSTKRRETVTGNSGPAGTVNYTVYGEIPSFDATVRGGVYSDEVTVTINF